MGETPLQIGSFDDFVEKDQQKGPKEDSLEERFSKERLSWSEKIAEMSKKMKDIFKVSELMTEIYTERQRAVEYHHYLISIFSQINRAYRTQWSARYDHYSYKSQKRFPNEKTKELQILSELTEITKKRDAIDNHIKFMNNTISTIDNLIYGIKYKVEIEQISRGK
jgi:hypothetical protein